MSSYGRFKVYDGEFPLSHLFISFFNFFSSIHLIVNNYFRRGQGTVPTPRKARGSLPLEEMNAAGGGDDAVDEAE